MTSARAVIDLEPGSRTVDATGPGAVGAAHRAGSERADLDTRQLCPPRGRSCGAGWLARRAGGGTVSCMCGRYASTRSAADLAALFDAVDETSGDLTAQYNVAPTDPAPLLRQLSGSMVLSIGRWGLVPPWAGDVSGAARMINARAETIATSRAYRQAFVERRCLIPADGWYEWMTSHSAVRRGGKQPYYLTRTDAETLVFGGVWSAWGAGSQRRITFSIVTLAAEGALARIHDRMPLVLEPNRWAAWLASGDAQALLVPASAGYLAGIEHRPVSTAVGDVRNNGPDLVRRVEPAGAASTMDAPQPTLF